MNTRIPQTDSIEELAAFWETHSVTEVEDELEEVTEPLFENTVTLGAPGNITVPLSPLEAEFVKTVARHQGISPSEVIREWIVKRIEEGR